MAEEKNEQAQAAPAQEQQAQPASPAPEKKETPKIEKPANCSVCNKSIKKIRWYYRNGKFFCTKRCWKGSLKKDEKKEEAKA